MDSLCCGKATLTPVLPIESPAKRVSIGEEKSICKGAFHFQWNAEFAKRTSTKWWAKMDSLCCGKATAVATVHWTVAKSRLSSPFWLSRPLRCSVLWGSVSFFRFCRSWWAKMDSNHRPHDYQSCALASWAKPPNLSHLLTRYIHCQLSIVNCQLSIHLCPLNWITLST